MPPASSRQSVKRKAAGRKTSEPAGNVDQMFRAFSDRTRLRILNVLQHGELCVGQIVEILEVTQPRVSQHLAYLRNAGLVIGRKEGLWMYYSLAEARTKFHVNLLDCLKQCFCEVEELKRDELIAVKVRKRGDCCEKQRGDDASCEKKKAGRA